jgi:hypothetical protein
VLPRQHLKGAIRTIALGSMMRLTGNKPMVFQSRSRQHPSSGKKKQINQISTFIECSRTGSSENKTYHNLTAQAFQELVIFV